jgi:hypothetical protein
MNKTAYLKLLALLAIDTFFSCSTHNTINDDDYLILNYLINKNADQQIILNEKNDNSYTINTLMLLKENYITSQKKDSINQVYGIKKDSVMNDLFSAENLDYFISQKNSSNWNLTKIENYYPNKLNNLCFISKPIYSKKHNFSLVNISSKNKNCILILIKKSNNWEEYKIIASLIQ